MFGTILLVWLIAIVIGAIGGLIASAVGGVIGALIVAIISALVAPVTALTAALIYFALLAEKEPAMQAAPTTSLPGAVRGDIDAPAPGRLRTAAARDARPSRARAAVCRRARRPARRRRRAVLLYHGGIAWLPGGFLGVDIFFVISGFLITSLLLAERRARGRIDLPRFWLRRARRLLPAAFL